MNIQKTRNYTILYMAFLIYSVSSICAKLASQQNTVINILFFAGLEIVCLGLYAVIWQQVLRVFSLVVAMSSKGIVVIFNIIWAMLVFGEAITVYNITGAFVIMCGIWMVLSDD